MTGLCTLYYQGTSLQFSLQSKQEVHYFVSSNIPYCQPCHKTRQTTKEEL